MQPRRYSVGEMTYQLHPTMADLLASLVKEEEHRLSENHKDDVVHAHPWLTPLVVSLKQRHPWEEIVKLGKVAVRLFGTMGEATLAIDYPLPALSTHLCKGLPQRFRFVLRDGAFEYCDVTFVS